MPAPALIQSLADVAQYLKDVMGTRFAADHLKALGLPFDATHMILFGRMPRP